MQTAVLNQVYILLDVTHPHSPDSYLGLLDSCQHWCSNWCWATLSVCQSKHERLEMALSATLPCIINLLVTEKHLTSDGLVFSLDWDVVGIVDRHSRASPVLWRSDSGRIREQWLHPSNYRWLWRNGRCAQGPEDKLLTAPLPFPAFALQLAETFNSHGRLCVCYHVFKKE